MINIGRLKLEILALAEPVQELVEGVVKAIHAHDGQAAHEAIEAALRLQFEARQALKHPKQETKPES